jgi:UbiD family decarboxylase
MASMKTPSIDEAKGNLREFIKQAESAGQLEIIQGADANLEIGALFELSFEKRYPPVLLFENIKNYPPGFRVVCNVRTAHFAAGDFNLETLRAFRRRQKEKQEPIPPREVKSGPIFENVYEGDAVNCLQFPAPKWHAGDGGNYIGTECMVITRDPDSDWVNFGTYRVMVQDERTLSVFIESGKHGDVIRRKYWNRGEPCPMAICVGQAPILGATASTPARHGESEYGVAGGLIGKPIDVVLSKVSGLPIPADAEIVFDGFMPLPENDSRPEGPFGEWPGYFASNERPEPVLQVHAVYHRNDPIIVGWPPTKPTKLGGAAGSITRLAAIWNALEAAGVPEICGVWTLPGAGYRFASVISIKQLHAGHAKMAGLVAAGCGAGAYMTRMIIVVDDDIDITNAAEVMWALSTRWDPKTQTDIIDDCWTGHIDPRLPPEKREKGDVSMSRIIMYAVRPFHWKEQYPRINEIPRAYEEEVRRKWEGKLKFLNG